MNELDYIKQDLDYLKNLGNEIIVSAKKCDYSQIIEPYRTLLWESEQTGERIGKQMASPSEEIKRDYSKLLGFNSKLDNMVNQVVYDLEKELDHNCGCKC